MAQEESFCLENTRPTDFIAELWPKHLRADGPARLRCVSAIAVCLWAWLTDPPHRAQLRCTSWPTCYCRTLSMESVVRPVRWLWQCSTTLPICPRLLPSRVGAHRNVLDIGAVVFDRSGGHTRCRDGSNTDMEAVSLFRSDVWHHHLMHSNPPPSVAR